MDVSEPEEPEAPMTRSRAKARSDPPSTISGPNVLPDMNAEEMAHKGTMWLITYSSMSIVKVGGFLLS